MKNIINIRLIKIVTIAIIISHIQYCFAGQDKQNLLMKALYEDCKKSDFTNDPVGKEQCNKLIKQYENLQEEKRLLDQKREKHKILEEALKISKERASAFDKRDMYHALEQNVAKQYGVSQEAAHKMIESNDPRANKVWNSMVQAESEKYLQEAKRRLQERKQQNSKK